MKLFAMIVGLATIAGVMVIGPAAGAAGPDKACVAEVRAAGDWGRYLNPGKATFVAGTPGDDVVEYVAPGVVFCGLGGNDRVLRNDGWFYGGADVDHVGVNNGIVHGGHDTDVVDMNSGLFEGGPDFARDVVKENHGVFDGGPGNDLVEGANFGTCIDVEVGCG